MTELITIKEKQKGGVIGSLIRAGIVATTRALLRKPMEMKGLYSASLLGSLGGLTSVGLSCDIGRTTAKEV